MLRTILYFALLSILVSCIDLQTSGGSDTETNIVPGQQIHGKVTDSNSIGLDGWSVQAISVDFIPEELSRDSEITHQVIEVQTLDSGFFKIEGLEVGQYYHLLILDSASFQTRWLDSVQTGSFIETELQQSRVIIIQKEFKPYDNPDSQTFVYFEGAPYITFCRGESTQIRYIPQTWKQLIYYEDGVLRDSIPLSESKLNQTFFMNPGMGWEEISGD